jgi:hypothetical protein
VKIFIFAAALLSAAAGCHRRAPTADGAYARLEHAIAAADAIEFYQNLDGTSRAAIKSVFSDQRLMRTIITAKYPEAAAQPELARLTAASAADVEHYFAAVARDRRLVEGYRKRLGSVSGPIAVKADGPDAAWVARADGMPFHFHRDSDGGWGFSELDAEWSLEKDRAAHAVQTVRDNARLYATENK